MATIPPIPIPPPANRDLLGCIRVAYSDVKAGDTCGPIRISRYSDRSVQVTGVYDGASVELHGTLDDDANYGLLSDQSGLDLRFTTGLRTRFITEATVYIKPVIIGGGALTNLKILIFGRGQVV